MRTLQLFHVCSNLGTIHRFDLCNNSTSNWSLNRVCYGLSLTKDHHLLVAAYDGRHQEYTTYGSLITEIALHQFPNENLFDSAQLPNSNFIVCSILSQKFEQHTVCIVESSGNIDHSYGGPKGSGVGQLNGPFLLIVDKRDNVFVADVNNHRVALPSPEMTHLGYIRTPGIKLTDPRSLHLEGRNWCLYIGEDNIDSGYVIVFQY